MINLPDKEKLILNFQRCTNREEKYLYIIELGERLPLSSDLPLKDPKNLVPGCQSQVWISVQFAKTGYVILNGDSDAAIIKGLIAIVFTMYDNMNPQEILDFNIQQFLTKISLNQQLTISRSQGLEAIIRVIRQKAFIAARS